MTGGKHDPKSTDDAVLVLVVQECVPVQSAMSVKLGSCVLHAAAAKQSTVRGDRVVVQ